MFEPSSTNNRSAQPVRAVQAPGPRPPAPAVPAGFTLIEISFALLILVIGISTVVVLFYGGMRDGYSASERNAATLLLPEAARAIVQEHLIPTTVSAAKAGMLVQTLRNSPESDQTSPFSGISVTYGSTTTTLAPPADLASTNLNEWPRRPAKPYLSGGDPSIDKGVSFRVHYRLEKHNDWVPHDKDGVEQPENKASAFRGVYVLTLVAYRTEEGPTPVFRQVSDPVVVLVRDSR